MLSTTDRADIRAADVDAPRRRAPANWVAVNDVEALTRLVECVTHVVDPGIAAITAVMQFDEMHPIARPLPYSLAALRACRACGVEAVDIAMPSMILGRFIPLVFTLRVDDLIGGASPGR